VEGVGGGARHGGPAVTGGYSMKERWIRWLRPPRISSPSSQMKTFNKSTSTVYYISALPTRIYVDRILSQTQSRILQEITVQKLL
jgi:hypothetical protein